MRGLVLGLLLAAASPLAAQSSASVNVRVRTNVPDMLVVRAATTEDYTRADGTRVRRITLYVTANRTWNLHVVSNGVVITTENGGRGTDVPVVLEVPWPSKVQAPDATNLSYMLTAA